MSRTVKYSPFYMRRPSGFRRAVINEARSRSIPPTSYDDITVGKEAYIHSDIIAELYVRGVSVKNIRRKLSKRGYTPWQINRMIDSFRMYRLTWLNVRVKGRAAV